MSIFKQLIVLVSVAIIGLIGISVLAIVKLDTVFEETNYGNTNSIPSLVAFDEAVDQIATMRVVAYKYHVETNPAQKQKNEERLFQAQADLEKVFKNYEKMISDDKDKAMLQADREAAKEYVALLSEIMNLSKNNQEEEAKALLLEKHKEIVTKLNETIENHLSYNVELSKKGAEQAVAHKKSADIWMIIISLIVIVITLFMSISIVKSIMNGVDTIHDGIKLFVQDKELKFRIKYEQKNEISDIVNSFNSLVETLGMMIEDAKKLFK